MTTLMTIVVYLVPIWVGLACLRRACLDGIRQQLYRIRYRIYDRVLAGELSLDDQNIALFVRFLHGSIHAMDNWDLVKVFRRLSALPKEHWDTSWRLDERIKDDVHQAFGFLFMGLLLASSAFRIAVVVGVPFCLLKRKWDEIKQDFEQRSVGVFTPYEQVRTA
jgi:hypothetical protein